MCRIATCSQNHLQVALDCIILTFFQEGIIVTINTRLKFFSLGSAETMPQSRIRCYRRNTRFSACLILSFAVVLNFFVINLPIAEQPRRPDRLLVKATTAWLPAETKIIETVDGMLNELNAKRHFLNVSPGSRNLTAFNQSSDTMENGQGGTMISTSTASVRVHDAYQTSLASCEDKSKTQHNQVSICACI